jgi:hypothetical protein
MWLTEASVGALRLAVQVPGSTRLVLILHNIAIGHRSSLLRHSNYHHLHMQALIADAIFSASPFSHRA